MLCNEWDEGTHWLWKRLEARLMPFFIMSFWECQMGNVLPYLLKLSDE